MCFEIAGSVISNGSASSLTVASPSARRARIARRVELARAAKVSLGRSSSIAIVTARPALSRAANLPIRKVQPSARAVKRGLAERVRAAKAEVNRAELAARPARRLSLQTEAAAV